MRVKLFNLVNGIKLIGVGAEVIGKATFIQMGDRSHVVLQAEKVESIDLPAEAML